MPDSQFTRGLFCPGALGLHALSDCEIKTNIIKCPSTMDKEYLQEGKCREFELLQRELTADFDPLKVKVAQLREILRENDIDFPPAAKKKELVGIFNETLRQPVPVRKRGDRSRADDLKLDDTNESIEIIEVDEKSESKPKKTKARASKKKVKQEDDSTIKDESIEKASSPDVSKASTADVSHTSKTESPHATKNPFASSPPSKKLKKRKSSVFEEPKKTPEKGNLFQVDVDSDSDTVIFSPKPKKAKTTPLPAPSKTTQRKVSKRLASRGTISPAEEIAKSAYQDIKDNLAKSTPTKSVEPAPKTEEPESKPEVSRPVLAPIPDSTTDVSRDESEDNFNNSLKNEIVDDSTGFDEALSRLKRLEQEEHAISKDRKDEEVARLLGVDLDAVKPKVKGRRSITPRRPLVIPERRLASDRGSLLDDLDKDNLPERIPSGEDHSSTTSDEEADTDVEDEADPSEASSLASKVKTRKPKFHKVATTLLFLGLWVFIIGLAMFGYWYREQTILVGYCGHEIHRPTVPQNADTPVLLSKLGKYLDSNLKPSCVPCPQHARCFSHLELGCYEDFVESKPWYYQYWPVFDPRSKRCIPDTKKAEKVELMIDEALDLLRARNANIQCGLTAVDNFEAGIEVGELHDLLLALKAPYITEEEFEDLWKRSVVELEKEPEITVRQVASIHDDPSGSSLLKIY